MAVGRIPKVKPPARRRAVKLLSTAKLTQLGEKAPLPASPNEAKLETVSALVSEGFVARFVCPEFTSLCPVTGQPDFAHIVIDYIPDLLLIESKSLKLFLASFRGHRSFHEACTLHIKNKLMLAAQPKWFRIGSYWYPRGGISIDVFYQSGSPPKDVWIPDQGVPPYRGR